jgi:hypothetical protein
MRLAADDNGTRGDSHSTTGPYHLKTDLVEEAAAWTGFPQWNGVYWLSRPEGMQTIENKGPGLFVGKAPPESKEPYDKVRKEVAIAEAGKNHQQRSNYDTARGSPCVGGSGWRQVAI